MRELPKTRLTGENMASVKRVQIKSTEKIEKNRENREIILELAMLWTSQCTKIICARVVVNQRSEKVVEKVLEIDLLFLQ